MPDVTPRLPTAGVAAPVIAAVAVASAVAAMVSAAAPVGSRAADLVWCALLGAAVPVVAHRATRAPLALLGVVAAIVGIGGDTTGQAAAVLSLVLVGVIVLVKEPTPVEGAILGAFAIQALLRGPSYGILGLPTLVGAAALAPMAYSSWRHCGPRWRRTVGRGVLVAGAVLAVSSLVGCVAAVLARPDLQAAAEHAELGVDALRAGRTETATELFNAAEDEFASADTLLGGPLTWTARLVPVLGQQLDALATGAHAGEQLAATAATTTTSTDYRGITPTGGAVDLDQLAALRDPVAATIPVIDGAITSLEDIRSPWLVEPIDRELRRLHDELVDTSDTATIAANGLAVAPSLLGADTPRRYFVAFCTPAESRDGGGLIGAFAIVTADQGRLQVERTGTTERIEPPGPITEAYAFEPPPDWQVRYGDLHVNKFVRNAAASPDWPTDAGVLAQLYPQAPEGAPIDGAIYADPTALAGLLALTGPIEVPGLPLTLDATNAEQYLLRDQYLAYGDDDELVEVRRDSLGAVAEATFAALTSRPLPDLGRMIDTLGPLVSEGHLRMSVADVAGETFLDDVGVSGRWTVRPGADVLSVRSADRLANKIDVFLHRTFDVETHIDPVTGHLRTTMTATLRNDSPPSGLPQYVIGNNNGYPDGTNLHLLTLYSAHQLVSATLDGTDTGVLRQRQFDLPVYSIPVDLPPQGTRTLVLELEGMVVPGAPYLLDVLAQPTANPDVLRLAVGTGGPAAVLHDGPLVERLEVNVTTWVE